MRGDKEIQSRRYNLGNPEEHKHWEALVNTLRAHEHDSGIVTRGIADYFVSSFQVVE